MRNFPIYKRVVYKYQGIMLGLIHWTDTKRLLGIKISSLIRLFSLILPVYFWLYKWGDLFFIIGILIFLWVQISYWRVRRLGYYRFVSHTNQIMATQDIQPLPKKTHIKANASGTFSVKDWEKNVVYRPAEYWQVPLGDHAIMVEHEPGRYLYQFFNAESMQEIKTGWLLFGLNPKPAISVTFLSIWGPEFNDDNISLFRRNNQDPQQRVRTIYLSFKEEDLEMAVWQNIVFDARQARSE